MAVASAAGKVGGELGSNLLKQLAQDPDPMLRKAAAKVAEQRGRRMMNSKF